jgi:hypothetical protein
MRPLFRQSIIVGAIVLTSVLAVFAGMWLALPAARLARPTAPGVDPVLALWGTVVAIACAPVAYWPAVSWTFERFAGSLARLLVSLTTAPLMAALPTLALIAIITQGFTYAASASQWLEAYGFFLGFSVLFMPAWTAALSYWPKR